MTPLKTIGGSAWKRMMSAWSLVRSFSSRLIATTSTRSDTPQARFAGWRFGTCATNGQVHPYTGVDAMVEAIRVVSTGESRPLLSMIRRLLA